MEKLGFADRLKSLRLSKNYEQAYVAKKLNVSRSLISSYESSTRLPSVEMLIRYSQLFKVSVDYLLGLEKQTTVNVHNLTKEQIKIIEIIINEYAKLNKKID
ncbi:MAG: hypothetical protein BGN88_01195 [Clostridiales bacterium 43-6]|nr:MAG: hypothetical protein BGN88_01195 [Clostridiales bacterium 43-6]